MAANVDECSWFNVEECDRLRSALGLVASASAVEGVLHSEKIGIAFGCNASLESSVDNVFDAVST
jgi:hypothetical protein